MYKLAADKGVDIARVIRIGKICAFDCHLTYHRNIRPGDVNDSRTCDYQNCVYGCFSPEAKEVDYSTYDILFSGPEVKRCIDWITEYVTRQSNSRVTITSPDLRSKFRLPIINRAVATLIREKRQIRDRFGFACFIFSDWQSIYLTKNFPTGTGVPTTIFDSQYELSLYGTRVNSFSETITSALQPREQTLLAQLAIDPESPVFDALTFDTRVQLLEKAIINTLYNQATPLDKVVYRKLQNYIHWMNDPIEDIRRVEVEIKGMSKSKRDKHEVKVNPLPTSPILYFHTYYGAQGATVSFAVPSERFRVTDRIRIFRPSENSGLPTSEMLTMLRD